MIKTEEEESLGYLHRAVSLLKRRTTLLGSQPTLVKGFVLNRVKLKCMANIIIVICCFLLLCNHTKLGYVLGFYLLSSLLVFIVLASSCSLVP
jgi:hypothetical protein